MIHKILTYDLCNLPRDIVHFFESKESWIIVVSLLYVLFILLVIYSLIELTKYSIPLACIFYSWCMALNYAIIYVSKFPLYLTKNKYKLLNKMLFLLLGPFSVLRALHLIVCLRIMTTISQFLLIVSDPTASWHDLVDKDPTLKNEFISFLAKYQERLN